MTLLNSILLGIIQGLAEFLPISSSGHLALFEEIFGINEAGMVFDVMLHLGTLVAIFVAFWKDIKKLFIEGIHIIVSLFLNLITFFMNLAKKGSEKKEYQTVIETAYTKFVILIIVSTIPTGILGVLLKDVVEKVSSSLIVVGICFIVTAVLLMISDNANSGRKRVKSATYSDAAIIGLVQGLATLPGISRSGSTITACQLCGFDKHFAVKYSFIMSIPAVLGAVILELKDFAGLDITGGELVNYGIGTLVAAIVGYICIKTMLVLIRGRRFKYFSYYLFAVGAFSIIWYLV